MGILTNPFTTQREIRISSIIFLNSDSYGYGFPKVSLALKLKFTSHVVLYIVFDLNFNYHVFLVLTSNFTYHFGILKPNPHPQSVVNGKHSCLTETLRGSVGIMTYSLTVTVKAPPSIHLFAIKIDKIN